MKGMVNMLKRLKSDIKVNMKGLEFNFNFYTEDGHSLWNIDGKATIVPEYTFNVGIGLEEYSNYTECFLKHGKGCGTSNYSFNFEFEGEDGNEYKVEINPYTTFPTAVTFYDWNEDEECWEYPKYHNDDEDCLLEDNSEILEGAYNFITDNLETIYAVIDNVMNIIDKEEMYEED